MKNKKHPFHESATCACTQWPPNNRFCCLSIYCKHKKGIPFNRSPPVLLYCPLQGIPPSTPVQYIVQSMKTDVCFCLFTQHSLKNDNYWQFLFQYKNVSVEKGQACDRARDEYRNQLEQTNSKQTLHYSSEMPAVFDVSNSQRYF